MSQVFPPCDGPRVMMLPPGADFITDFLDGLRARLAPHPPEIWAQTEIYVNTERSQRRLSALLEAGPVTFKPKIRVFSDLAMAVDDVEGSSELEQRLELAQLIRGLITAQPDFAARNAAIDLAESLSRLKSEMQAEGIPWQSLAGIEVEDQSGHWQRSLRFMQLIEPLLDPQHSAQNSRDFRLRAAMLSMAESWNQNPVSHPVIVAGSTGSRGASAEFMKAVANLPEGAVVLPGFDTELPDAAWDRLISTQTELDHPQFGYASLSQKIGFEIADVKPWNSSQTPNQKRNALVSLAMRPAPITDQWLQDGPPMQADLANAMQGVSIVEAKSQRQEALAIALRMRQALAQGEKCALITPDRTLSRRVAAFLDRWNIKPDDSAGRPLALTPPGVFLRLVANLFTNRLTPASLMAVLKHPLCASGPEMRGPHMLKTRALENDLLRGGSPVIIWEQLTQWSETEGETTAQWMNWLRETLKMPVSQNERELSAHLNAHLKYAETLARGPSAQSSGLWEEEAGEKAREAFDNLIAASTKGGLMDLADYKALVRNLLAGVEVPAAAYAPHPDIAIWGTLEARTETADVVILGSLNDETWPGIAQPDPWLNRAMRKKIGLLLPERQIGLSAHDFQQSMGAKTVLMTRAARDHEAPKVASRWWIRLTNLLGGLGESGAAALDASFACGDALLALADQFDQPLTPIPSAARPAPCPPVAVRPSALAVTRIETLSNDPYAIYAQYILGLRPLSPLGRDPDPRERGTISHTILHEFIERTKDGLPEDAHALFTNVTDEILEKAVPWAVEKTLWRSRLMLFADWFLDSERQRRAIGAPFALESRGKARLDATPHPFTLSATADRIDQRTDGSLAVFDYKSSLPSRNAQEMYVLQLALEAAIATQGGFEQHGNARVEHLELISIANAGEARIVGGNTAQEVAETTALAWQHLNQLIAAYQTQTTAYTARLRPDSIKFDSDYDHLSRLGEWSDGDPPDGGADD